MDINLIKKSYLYNELYEKFGLDFIVDAGYYDNGVNIALEADPYMIDFLDFRERHISGGKNALVYITGSFAPIHDGHINSVIKACETLSENGYNVLGGVISPDHDKYVVDNKIHRNDLNINARISLVKDKIKNIHDYPLVCDIWNGLFNTTAINFTELTEFLNKTLALYGMAEDTEVFFVCGGDNARFAKTFIYKHGAVIIDRPDYEDECTRVLEEIKVLNPDAKIYYSNGGSTLSSTQVRREQYSIQNEISNKRLVLKVEDDEREMYESILPILKKYYSTIQPVYNKDLRETLLVNIEKFLLMDNDYKIICLDRKFYKYMQENFGNSQIFSRFVHYDMSRIYRVNGLVRNGYITKPIPKGNDEKCILIDDDSASGETLKTATQTLEKYGYNVHIKIIMNPYDYKEDSEIMDLSDLIFDKENGGLVMGDNFGNPLKRYPYILPFVSPYDRASVNSPLDFTIDIIEWNKRHGREHELANKYLINFKALKNGLI